MRRPLTPNRHTAKGGIHGEYSNRHRDRPLGLRDLVGSAVVLSCLYLMLCIGAAYGY